MTIRKSTAIIALVPNADFSLIGQKEIIWHDNRPQPTEEEIQAKIAELEALEPLRLLREQRNQLLSQTDWWATTDRTMSNDQQIYRQKLRDLPANTTPSLDSDGQLTNVTWPTKPE